MLESGSMMLEAFVGKIAQLPDDERRIVNHVGIEIDVPFIISGSITNS